MGWVFLGIGALVVLVIAFVALGRSVGQLATERPPAVYELPAAVQWIAQRLPEEVTARLSYDDLSRVLGWHLDWFTEAGVASRYGEEIGGTDIVHEGAVAVEEAAVDAVVARSIAEARRGQEIEPVDIVCVLDLQMQYLTKIGAVGTEATPPQ